MAGPERSRSSEVVLGEIVGTFGIRGEVRVRLENPGERWDRRPVVLEHPRLGRREAVVSLRPGAGRRIIGRIDGVDRPEDAEALVGSAVVTTREALPALEEGSYDQRDVLGLAVRTEGGRPLGRVVAIHDRGDVHVWEVEDADGHVRWVPALASLVLGVVPGEAVTVADSVGDQDAI
jgi:16S rRNA processing protein RimM